MTDETKTEQPIDSTQPEKKSLINPNDNVDLKDAKLEEGKLPEGLDEKFWDAEKKQVKVDDLTKDYLTVSKRAEGLRKELSKGKHNAPEAPDKYKVTFDDVADEAERKALQDSIIDSEENVLLQEFKKNAHAAGLSQEQFNNLVRPISKFINDQVAEVKPETDEEFEVRKAEEYKKIGKNAPQIIRAVSEFTLNMERMGNFNKEDVKIATQLASSAEGVSFLNRLRMVSGGDAIAMDASMISDGLPTDKEIASMIQSKQYHESADYRDKVEVLLNKRKDAGRPTLLQV